MSSDDAAYGSIPDAAYGKATAGFKRLTTSLEPSSLGGLGTDRTPVDQFFVCAGSPAPRLDPETHAITIEGDAVAAGMTINLSALQALPQHTVTSWLECAGNGRAMYDLAGGYSAARDAADTGWTLGAMGIATWQGPRLSTVLSLAGVQEAAAWVSPRGADVDNREGEAAQMCLPIEKAMHPDTIIALQMNDAPLERAHGFPARLLVPGWVGAYSVKWLERIEVSAEWVPSWRADEYYVHRTADGTKLGPATAHPIKSCLALDWDAELEAGPQTMRGYARCGSSQVERVEISIDDGPWFDAALTRVDGQWAWLPFHFTWDATPGAHQIRTRAWDENGETQPDTKAFHPNTILWNAVTRHPVSVAATSGARLSSRLASGLRSRSTAGPRSS